MLSDIGCGCGDSECSGCPILIFFINENWICAMTRQHAESNINILLTRNLLNDSGVRQWSHSLMMPLYCLSTKSNNKTSGQFECDMTWFCFCFDFIGTHALEDANGRGCEGWISFKNEHPSSRGWKKFQRRWTEGGKGYWKLNNFHGRHMRIVP